MITNPSFWRTAGVRAVRNAAQVVLPFLALVAAGRIDKAGVLSVLAAAALAGVLSVAKTLSGLTVDDTAPLTYQLAERALGAGAGALAALLPLDLAGAVSADWASIATAVAGAAALSIVTRVAEHAAPEPDAPRHADGA